MMLCEPPLRLLVVSVACALPFSETAEPSGEAPSKKVTLPVGVAGPGVGLGVTLAVKVTLWPNTLGFCELITDVVVGYGLTVTVVVADVVLVQPLVVTATE